MAGNAIAQLMLLFWLPLALVVASMVKSPQRAFLIVVVGGAMFLPELVAFDFPLVPPFNKHVIAMMSAAFALLATKPGSITGRQNTGAAVFIGVSLVVLNVVTGLKNPEPLFYGVKVLPGLTLHDILSFVINDLLHVLLPYYLGQALFRTPEHLRELLRALVIGALIYVPFILAEARLSPIVHLKLYGFFQHEFLQAVRAGGFRAFVCMSHGLVVALFVSLALTSAAGLSRTKAPSLPLPAGVALLVLVITLITCKSMGAIIYAIVSVPLVWFTSARMQARVASWLAVCVLTYPLLRMFGLISTEWFLEQATAWGGADRAQSLEFRFLNEIALLEKAQERPYFGWGGWGRNQIFEASTGKNLSVTDGEWIIQFGVGGAFRYALVFGLLLLPVLSAKKTTALLPKGSDDARLVALTAVLLAFTGVDLLPNALSHKIPFVMAGALTSVAAGVLQRARSGDPSLASGGARVASYGAP